MDDNTMMNVAGNELYGILNQNEHCYQFKYMKNTDGIFHNTIDATYVVHLKGNGRYESVMKQLNEYHLTNDVFILHNEGFKKCDKTSNIVYPADDLVDAFFQIFKHANEKKYENILILEDDFIFTNDIKNTTHINNITNFLIKRTNQSFIYYLGCLPYLSLPIFDGNNTYFPIISSGMHSVIYSKKYRENLSRNYIKMNVKDWDLVNNYSMNKYMYCQPLCYQLFSDTENRRTWGKSDNNHISGDIVVKIITLVGVDKKIEPGYSIFYAISKILPLFMLLSLMIIYIKFTIVSKKYMKEYKIKVNRKWLPSAG
jgi:hypothetical protein